MNNSTADLGRLKLSLKELSPAYIIAFAFCFMLFVYEPVLMYCNQQLDFWFDLPIMIVPVLLGFLVFLLGSVVVITAVYFAGKILFKEKWLVPFRIIRIAIFGIFFVTFLQGNILSMNLPALDGTEIDWKELQVTDIITLAAIIVIAGLLIFLSVKRGTKATLKYITIFTIGVFVFLTIFLTIEMVCWNAFKRKDSIITTDANFNTLSSDQNFVILLCDAVGSSEFKKVLDENPEYREIFEDFTYCPDTLGGYPCTRDSIPLILGGQMNKNEKEFSEFSSKTLNSSPLFKELSEKEYDINLYEAELVWYGNRNYEIQNGSDFKKYKLPFKTFMFEELKYVGYKYLPYILKQYSDIENMNFNGLVDKYIQDDRTVYKSITQNPVLTKVPEKVFSYVHFEGAHTPFKYDKDLNIIESGGTYEQKIEATITMLKTYLERLKTNDAYDNTVIVILADHGNAALVSADDMLIRGNPVFMIKGISEKHEFCESQKPVSYLDLMDIYSNLLGGESAEEALSFIPDSRERIYMWYRYRFEYHMEEYIVTGKAWEWQKFEKTGNEYDLY